MSAVLDIEQPVADHLDDGAGFFAPVSFDLIDSLLSEHDGYAARIAQVAEWVKGPAASSVMHYFLEGNRTEQRGRHSLELSAAQLFDPAGALAELRGSFWSKALALTDMLDIMPQKRRDAWHESIRNPAGKRKDYHDTQRDRANHPEWFNEDREYIDPNNAYSAPPLPPFEDGTVRATLAAMLAERHLYLGERVDGIFQSLSGAHVTNSPEGFGKRLIIANVAGVYGKEGIVNDLRCVVAKFMGRDEPKYDASSRLMSHCKARRGQWVMLDGGALKIRVYGNNNAHMEVHPDMAWRLNQILAYLHPAAIPSEFRQKPKRKAKAVALIQRPLPFAVLSVLGRMEEAMERVEPAWQDRYRRVPKTRTFRGASDMDKHVADEVRRILETLGGVPDERGYTYTFDYEPCEAIGEIVVSGCLPDAKAHQFYPTRERLARMATELAAEGVAPDATWCEPSAGMGGLADYMPKDRTTCVEVSALHCKVLEAKGFATICADFLEWAEKPGRAGSFDRVVLNPPFDRGQWRAHLEHAAALVRAGGRLVAILPSGARGTALPGFNTTWQGPYADEFPGASVEVVILVADRI